MSNLAKQIQDKLVGQNIYANVYDTQFRNVVCVNIDGDWKHEHGYAKCIIEKMFPNCSIRTTIINQDGSDWYEADHYVIVPKEVA